jgi:hypothetical protein
MKTRATMLLTLAMAGAACAPSAPLEVGSRQIPVDITLGNQSGEVPPRPPGLNPAPIGLPGFIQPPVPRLQPGDVPPPIKTGPCPIANPLDAAELVARQSAKFPPVETTYRFRNQGSFTVGDAVPVPYPDISERTVTNVRTIEGEDNYEFDVAIGLANQETTTTYRVLNSGDTLDRGVFIVAIVTQRSDGADAFIPEPPILLMPFPPPEFGTNLEDELDDVAGPTYRSSGTDPISQTTMILEAQIESKVRVDACGRWIDAFDIEVLTGRIIGPDKQIEFTGRYAIATQYGALVVEDDIRITGTDRFEDVESRNRARITRLPKEPPGAFS